jgi:hypothetical protein
MSVLADYYLGQDLFRIHPIAWSAWKRQESTASCANLKLSILPLHKFLKSAYIRFCLPDHSSILWNDFTTIARCRTTVI